MDEQLQQIEQACLTQLAMLTNAEAVTELYRSVLGRTGKLRELQQQLGQLSADLRPAFGRKFNEVKIALQQAFDDKQEALRQAEITQALSDGSLDVTLPGRPISRGGFHPSTRVLHEIYRIFGDMGFQIYRSPDVVTDELNFELINMPPEHPARDMQDTFYTTDNLVLRTHTSAGQILAMREQFPNPVRVILPGMCYRNEQITARSEIQFHQVEGLAIGENISFADLKGTLNEFARRFYGSERQTRFRASYFPFTEPSAEMDVSCSCGGKGCRICKNTGWLEVLGCGMVHPTVLRNGGYDPQRYRGFAFGMGIERTVMLKYDIPDIRYFWSNDLRWLQQF